MHVEVLLRRHINCLSTTFRMQDARLGRNIEMKITDVISGRGDVGLITLVDVYFTKITLRV